MFTRSTAVLLVLLAPSVSAMCPIQQVEVAGTVISEETSKPVIGARVLVSLDPKSEPRGEENDVDYADYALTDEEGRFRAVSHFDTLLDYSDQTGHICTAVPSHAELFVLSRGFLSYRQSLSLEGLNQKAERFLVELKEPIRTMGRICMSYN